MFLVCEWNKRFLFGWWFYTAKRNIKYLWSIRWISVFLPAGDLLPKNDHKVIVYLDVTNLLNLIDDEDGIIREYSNRSRQIILDEDNPYDSQGRYNIVGVDPDDGLFVQNRAGQSSYQWNLGFKYQF